MPGKPLVWLHGEVKSPPFSAKARAEAGYLLRLLQEDERLSLSQSRPMPTIEVFQKKSRATPKQVVEVAKKRLKRYLTDSQED